MLFLYFLLTVAIVLVALAIIIARQPDEFRVTRSATIPAPPSVVFEQVNDLRCWAAWSPWDRIDPDSKKTFHGPAAGLGASYSWVGPKTGQGQMTVIESRPNEFLRFQLDFVKPFKANNNAEFTFTPQGDQTVVTWTMTGKNNFISKTFSLLMNCDKMVGGQFDQGLANLKTVSEEKLVAR